MELGCPGTGKVILIPVWWQADSNTFQQRLQCRIIAITGLRPYYLAINRRFSHPLYFSTWGEVGNGDGEVTAAVNFGGQCVSEAERCIFVSHERKIILPSAIKQDSSRVSRVSIRV